MPLPNSSVRETPRILRFRRVRRKPISRCAPAHWLRCQSGIELGVRALNQVGNATRLSVLKGVAMLLRHAALTGG
jgi:hypothetical protein